MEKQNNINKNVYYEGKVPYMKKQKNITKIFKFEMSVFELFREQNAKCMQRTLYGKSKEHYQDSVLSVFQLLTYQNVKTHVKHLLWKNGATLPKPYFNFLINQLIN